MTRGMGFRSYPFSNYIPPRTFFNAYNEEGEKP